MYGIFANIYHKNQPNADKHTSPMDPMGIVRMESGRKDCTRTVAEQKFRFSLASLDVKLEKPERESVIEK